MMRLEDARPGLRVWYWTRRPGERSRLIRGVIKALTEDRALARVEGHDTCVQVHTIETKRLHVDEPASPNDRR